MLTWNSLADCCATNEPRGFPKADPAHLAWEWRMPRIVETVRAASPDVFALLEMDRVELAFAFCDDGEYEAQVSGDTAVFYRTAVFTRLGDERIDMGGGKYAVLVVLRHKATGKKITFIAAHLKAKAEFADVRVAQVAAVITRLFKPGWGDGAPEVFMGDFNCEPGSEEHRNICTWMYPVHDKSWWTTCKWRDGELIKRTIDYMFVRDPNRVHLDVTPIKLCMPEPPEFGFPSADFPSDHLPLAADVQFVS